MIAAIFPYCPSNMGFVRRDQGLWEMANWIAFLNTFTRSHNWF